MGKKDKAGDNSPADLLDIRGLPREEQVRKLASHYLNAHNIWKNYPDEMVDPRLKEQFHVLSCILESYKNLKGIL